MRVVGLTGVTVHATVGAATGVAQLRVGRSPQAVDCPYRVELLRERIVADLNRPRHIERDPTADETLTTLLRETQAHCAKTHPDLLPRFERLAEIHGEHLERERRDAEVRHELRAIQDF